MNLNGAQEERPCGMKPRADPGPSGPSCLCLVVLAVSQSRLVPSWLQRYEEVTLQPQQMGEHFFFFQIWEQQTRIYDIC